jgi:hypothetical protein
MRFWIVCRRGLPQRRSNATSHARVLLPPGRSANDSPGFLRWLRPKHFVDSALVARGGLQHWPAGRQLVIVRQRDRSIERGLDVPRLSARVQQCPGALQAAVFWRRASGELGDATATTHALGGAYFPLLADGSLGAPVTSVTLRNGEGSILIKTRIVGASNFVVTGFPSTTGGAPGSFTITAKDTAGNTVTGYTGTVHFTSSDALAVLPPDYTFTPADAGTHRFQATLRTPGIQSLPATDSS